jgi:undecaprenyl-diphosphatase
MEGAGPVARGGEAEESPSSFFPLAARLVPPVSSCAALIIVFIGLMQFDLPIVRYVRSVTIHLPWDQLTVPWMAFTSNAGDWIGEGSHLITLSVILLAAGWLFSQPTLKAAGIQTLIAHGIAALVSNGLKHLLGRPRPKFVHSGEWQFSPSWSSGLDSFPSGHTTASFAVATVLAKRFPAVGLLCLGVAAFVGLSRILRGSHFPTDVMGGAVAGVVSGSLAAAPWKEWRTSIQDGLRRAAAGTAAIFALLWALAHPAEQDLTGVLLIGLGVAGTAGGLWLRRIQWGGKEGPVAVCQTKASPALLAYGLAAMTTSALVVASAGFACLAYWLDDAVVPAARTKDSRVRVILRESLLVGAVLLALLILFAGRGVLPFR